MRKCSLMPQVSRFLFFLLKDIVKAILDRTKKISLISLISGLLLPIVLQITVTPFVNLDFFLMF